MFVLLIVLWCIVLYIMLCQVGLATLIGISCMIAPLKRKAPSFWRDLLLALLTRLAHLIALAISPIATGLGGVKWLMEVVTRS